MYELNMVKMLLALIVNTFSPFRSIMTGIPVMDLCNLWTIMTGIPVIPFTHTRTAIDVI